MQTSLTDDRKGKCLGVNLTRTFALVSDSLVTKCHISEPCVSFSFAGILHFLPVAAAGSLPLSLSLSCSLSPFAPFFASSAPLSLPPSLHPGGQKPRLIAFSIAHGFLVPLRPDLCSKRACCSVSEHISQSLSGMTEHTAVVNTSEGDTPVGLARLSDIIRY